MCFFESHLNVCFCDSIVQELLVLDTSVASAATEEVLGAHSIPSMVSKDLLDLIEGRKFLIGSPVVNISSDENENEPAVEVLEEAIAIAE